MMSWRQHNIGIGNTIIECYRSPLNSNGTQNVKKIKHKWSIISKNISEEKTTIY